MEIGIGVQITKKLAVLFYTVVPKAIDGDSRTDISNYAPEDFVFNNRAVNC